MDKYIKLNRLTVLFISIGLLILSFEVYLEHHEQLSIKPVMWTPIVYGLLGGTFGIIIFFIFNRFSFYLFLFFMLCGIVVGTLGLYFHNAWRFLPIYESLFKGVPFDFNILFSYTPLLAPSAFAGLGSIGILVSVFNRWNEGA